MERERRDLVGPARRQPSALLLVGAGMLIVMASGLVAFGVVRLSAGPPSEESSLADEAPLGPSTTNAESSGASDAGVPSSACRAMARWGALANPGAADEAERSAWADVEAEMVAVTGGSAVAAYDAVVQAWNDGAAAISAEMLKGLEAINATGDRNAAMIERAAERAAAGDFSAASSLELEEYSMPDIGPLAEAKIVASANIRAAVNRFTSLC